LWRRAGRRPRPLRGAPRGGAEGTDWDAPPEGPGNLRVDYVLPSRAGLTVTGAGVVWPEGGDLAEAAARASAHRLVWVDLLLD
ncbi:hypothetical protein NHG85_07675, partial [Limimaricola sp. ASW11-118]|nr:hypothetical protein [Limimaricola litoreus]